ncbi:MAG TPA: DNA double-strand break repair nuclease NurA [Candidatus Methanoperedenaceae archaeon]|nr:DNA double-strand break repair nuclease NurA [Candidatus Methanoperedenaceae archaeon]
MINLAELSLQFDLKRDALFSYERERSLLAAEYKDRLVELDRADTSMNGMLPAYSGARLLEGEKLIREFGKRWKNRSEAIEWVDSVLGSVTVGAVDGSQIYAEKLYNIPVGAVQVASVFNSHTGEGVIQKTGIRLITPDEFEAHSVHALSREFVDARRFEAECDALIGLMEEHEGIFVMLDGALVLPHVNFLNEALRSLYVKAVTGLLEVSERTMNPVIGFIDSSMPRDVTRMMGFLFGLPETKLSDVYLFNMDWGDRTRSFLCDRDDRRQGSLGSVLDSYGRFRDGIAFFYMRTGSAVPSRVEFPGWAHERGLVEKIADIVRAEAVIRGGYPDLLMRAHNSSVIHAGEHRLFYGMLENFCRQNGIRLDVGAKQFHKTHTLAGKYS